MKGKISEIFSSIQGEGIYAGEKQLFVRFFGCNLRCKFCDTPQEHFSEYEPEILLQELKSYPGSFHSVSFTGGEPLLQKDFLEEVLRISRINGFKNYLETNGTLPAGLAEVIEYTDIIAMDFKLPSSTGLNDYWAAHERFLRIASQKEVFLKAVVCESTKEEDLLTAINLIKKSEKAPALVLQPNSYENSDRLTEKLQGFKKICEGNRITCSVIPQMHKLMGVR